jgi:chorismate mutase
MRCRGIRGATSVDANTGDAILRAARQLLEQIVTANDLQVDDLVSVTFTATADLDAAYPGQAAREMGWVNVPLLCVQEMAVADSLPRCIRVLVLWNTDSRPSEIRHVYLGRARGLRPDLIENETEGEMVKEER